MVEQIWSRQIVSSIVDFLPEAPIVVFMQDWSRIRRLSLQVQQELRRARDPTTPLVRRFVQGQKYEINGKFCFVQAKPQDCPELTENFSCLWLPEKIVEEPCLKRLDVIYPYALKNQDAGIDPSLLAALGTRQLSYVLKGWYNKDIIDKGLHRHPHFTRLKEWSIGDIQESCHNLRDCTNP